MQTYGSGLLQAAESYRQARGEWNRRQDDYWLLCALERAEASYERAWTKEMDG